MVELMEMDNFMKILFVRNIAGTSTYWRKALISLGHEAKILETYSNRFRFGNECTIPYLGAKPISPQHIFANIPFELSCWLDCDAAVVNYGMSPAHDFLPSMISRKPFIVVLHGTDARIKNLSNNLSRLLASGYSKKIFVSTPDLLEFFPAAELIERPVFIPENILQKAKARTVSSLDPIKIAHFPSNRAVKGTATIIKAIEQLRDENLHVEFRIYEGLPHTEVLNEMANADIVIDWINRDFGIYGMVSIEAMAMGKPAVSYINYDFFRNYPGRIPIISPESDNAESLAASLRELIVGGREIWSSLGENGKAFVEKVHNPVKQAISLLDAIEK